MDDPTSIILQLGALQSEAAQRGDDRAAATLRSAAEVLIKHVASAEALAAQRTKAAARQKRRRDRVCHVTSRDVTLGHVTAPEVSPDPFLTPEDEDNNARERVDERLLSELLDQLRGRMGDRMSDVDAFLQRRDRSTWLGWTKEILSCMMGGRGNEDDAAQVCRDDAVLERRIATPKGFRAFIDSAARERTLCSAPESQESAPRRGAKRARGEAAFAKIMDLVRSSPDPRQGISRFISLDEVEKLGPVAARAYREIGGANCVLAAIQKPETVGFVRRDYVDAYARAESGRGMCDS